MSQNRWCHAERLFWKLAERYKLAGNWVHQAPRERSLSLGTLFVMRLKPAPAREDHPEDVQRVMAKKKCWKFWNFQKFWNSEIFWKLNSVRTQILLFVNTSRSESKPSTCCSFNTVYNMLCVFCVVEISGKMFLRSVAQTGLRFFGAWGASKLHVKLRSSSKDSATPPSWCPPSPE